MPGSRAGSSGSFFHGGGSGRPAWSSGSFGGHGQQLGQRVLAEDLVDALGGARYRRRGDEGVRGREQLEVLLRVDQGVMRDQRRHVGQFGAIRRGEICAARAC